MTSRSSPDSAPASARPPSTPPGQTGTLLGIAILGTILANHLESATPHAHSDAFVNGPRPSLLTAGLIVLTGAALLVTMPVERR